MAHALAARRLDALLALAAAGTAIAAYLTWVAFDEGSEIACGPLGDCHTVQSSQYAEVAGVPVGVLGLAMYAGLLAVIGTRLRWRESPAMPVVLGPLTFALAFGGAVYSAYLTYLELFVIDAICAWCVASAVVVTAIWLLSLPDARAGRSGWGDV